MRMTLPCCILLFSVCSSAVADEPTSTPYALHRFDVLSEEARYQHLMREGPEVQGRELFSAGVNQGCTDSLVFSVTDESFRSYRDTIQRRTDFYASDPYSWQVFRHTIDSALNRTQVVLPLAYGVPMFIEDLDRDGVLEIAVQRGDPGFGGNGYLDIHSMDDWALRDRFVLTGRKVRMRSIVVDLDGDGTKEAILNPNDYTSATLIVVKYNPASDHFELATVFNTPDGAYATPAWGDFDEDGRLEIIWGGNWSYSIFEVTGTAITYVGDLDSSLVNNCAVACRPNPDNKLRALLGHSHVNDYGWSYHLYEPVGDNVFALDTAFFDCLGWGGIPEATAADVNCDGTDEMIMAFNCFGSRVLMWDGPLSAYVQGCQFPSAGIGSIHEWQALDVNYNGKAEWIGVGGNYVEYPIHVIFDRDCIGCDGCGHCDLSTPTVCGCPCHGDPICDSVINILDVTAVVDVAFRGQAALTEACNLCSSIQRSDVDCDGAVNIVDVVRVVAVAFRGQPMGSTFCTPCYFDPE